MFFLRRIDIYLLKQYCLLLLGTFFICDFIFLMQFVWLYMSDLVGKGLGFAVLARFLGNAALTVVPVSLPLAVMLASLITFGGLGERLELLSMKSAGISLLRILRPVTIFVLLVCVGSFYFQNVVRPHASRELARLLYSMRQKSPELEIPEGIFYNEIPGYNLFVEHKNLETGMLYGIMIYTQGNGFDDTQIVLADSGRLQSTADQQHLQLTLYDGERFRNMQNTGSAMDKNTVPYMRESFRKEVDIIAFDNSLNLMDASAFNGSAQCKNLAQLTRGIDSITHEVDSMGAAQYENYRYGFLSNPPRAQKVQESKNSRVQESKSSRGPEDSHPSGEGWGEATPEEETEVAATLCFDTLYAHLDEAQKARVYRIAAEKTRSAVSQTALMSDYSSAVNRSLRMHKLEWHAKFSLAVACLIFFFIGAPLGAIIRKGGLGVPVVTSVLFFIFYYIINTSGEKMAKSGTWDPMFGQWMSSMVLAPLAVWLTWKANQDSAVFNIEAYQMFFRRLLGIPIRRHLDRKEVILFDPDYERLAPELQDLSAVAADYIQRRRLHLMPRYSRLFFHYAEDRIIIDLSDRLEQVVAELTNTRDARIIGALNLVPILVPDAHTRPFRSARMNRIVGIVFPVGLLCWLRVWRYRLRLRDDLLTVQHQCEYITNRIQHQS